MHFSRFTETNEIVVLGESTMFIINESNGNIRYQKRFSFTPACFIPYNLNCALGDELYVAPGMDRNILVEAASRGNLKTPGFMTLMGSFEGYLNIYKDIKLAWTTKLQFQPIFVNTAVFQKKSGLIVCLSDSGMLQICFLGTD